MLLQQVNEVAVKYSMEYYSGSGGVSQENSRWHCFSISWVFPVVRSWKRQCSFASTVLGGFGQCSEASACSREFNQFSANLPCGKWYLEANAQCLYLKFAVSAVELLPHEAQVHKHQWIVQSIGWDALKALELVRFTTTGKMGGKRNCWVFSPVQSKKLLWSGGNVIAT